MRPLYAAFLGGAAVRLGAPYAREVAAVDALRVSLSA